MTRPAIRVMLRLENSALSKELGAIIASLPDVRLCEAHYDGPCEVIFLEVGEDAQSTFAHIQSLQSSGKAANFFLSAQDANPQVLIQAMKMGVKEFFPQPLNHEDVRQALSRIVQAQSIPDQEAEQGAKQGKIITVFGTKGGVGTTTIAVNLAASLAGLEDSPSVVLVDMNLNFGEVPLFLSMEPVFDWVEVLRNIARLDKTYMLNTFLKHPGGMHVLPAPAGYHDEHAIKLSTIEELFGAMQKIFDYIVVDTGQSFTSTTRSLMRMSDSLLLVTLLSLPCLINTRKLLSTLTYLGYPDSASIKILVNRAVKNSDITLKDSEESIEKKVFAAIPNDYDTTMRAINLGKPIRMLDQGTEINDKFEDLAYALAGKIRKKKQGLFFRSRRT